MKPSGILLVLLCCLAACSASDVTERYRAEREFYGVEHRFSQGRDEQLVRGRSQWRRFAADYEAVANRIEEDAPDEVRIIQGRARLRAAECYFASIDSIRAQLLLANLAESHVDLPEIFGEVSLGLGRISERHGQYLSALEHFQDVLDRVPPDPREEESDAPKTSARMQVIDLPLRMARIAARIPAESDPDGHYARARDYYSEKSEDPSIFIRAQATMNLADIEADLGEFARASQLLDELEQRILPSMMHEIDAGDIRLASFRYQVEAWTWGRTEEDSLRVLLDRLLQDHPRGRVAPAALLAMARGAAIVLGPEAAFPYLERLRRDHVTSDIVPEADLLRAQLLKEANRWTEARSALRVLSLEFPTSEVALRAPLEITAYHRQIGDFHGEVEALQEAEKGYRDVLTRYPEGAHTFLTREKLIQTLTLQGRHTEALEQLIALCDEVATPEQLPALLVDAARRAESQVGDPLRAAELLGRVAVEFPHTLIGKWCDQQVRRLRQ